MMTRFAAGAALVLAAPSWACFGGDRDDFARMPSDTIPLVLGAGDLLITTTDSTMQLGLVGDTVLMQFSDRMRQKLRTDLDTTHLRSSNRLGAAIERMVKRKVGAMLGRRLVRPLAEIDSVSLDGNRIVFAYRDRGGFNFDSMKNDRRPTLESFSPEDARRFVDAVRERKSRRI